MGNLHNILQLVCKYSTIPQSPLRNVLFCHFHCWLLFESRYHCSLLRSCRNNISVFFTGICRFNSHQYQICLFVVCLIWQFLQRLKVICLHIGIYRTYNDRFLRGHSQHIHQVCRSQRNGRKSISSARLYGNSYIFTQLVMNCWDLCLACSNCHCCFRIYLFDLVINSLHHGLIRSIFLFENLNKLLASNIIR